MENATKALLTAAVVLIVILLIAFGMRIFNSASSAGDAETSANTISNGITKATVQMNSSIINALK